MSKSLHIQPALLRTPFSDYHFYRIETLEQQGLTNISALPFCIRVLLEMAFRQFQLGKCSEEDLLHVASWTPQANRQAFPFYPARVLMQDFTGVPAIVDLAAMRSALFRLGKDAQKVNPLLPLDLVIDHSLQVDYYACPDAEALNTQLEFQRNQERYQFLRWGQKSFSNFRVVPPSTGIVHQVNIEYLAPVVMTQKRDGHILAFPDTLVGTDSHTTMVNALGVVGWGVGGIEAEAVMLNQPLDLLLPDVIGFRLEGKPKSGISATDIVLTITSLLRKKGVVGKFVEFFGPGFFNLSLADRATISNMAPEYGATIGFFPIDQETLNYLALTGRSSEHIALVEQYCKAQHLFYTPQTPDPSYTEIITLDLSTVEPCIAGPKRPHDLIPLKSSKKSFQISLTAPLKERGFELSDEETKKTININLDGKEVQLQHGSVVIAAITSCTNTSNPFTIIEAALLAKNAVEKGLSIAPYVKTSFAPGSRVVVEYLQQSHLLDPLRTLGFDVVGYGCTTCIGNSGPLKPEIAQAIRDHQLVAVAVLSGNRNFEGRIHPLVRANYLASPALVIAYALAGRMDIDFAKDPLGYDKSNQPIYLADIFPTQADTHQIVSSSLKPELFIERYKNVFDGNERWNSLNVSSSVTYDWQHSSTYIQEPPFFKDFSLSIPPLKDIIGARVLVYLGDSITTDHISPAGSIAPDSPAGKYLISQGVEPADFNSYGARRGNDQVMTRGTFANVRLKNKLVPGKEGGITKYFPSNEVMPIYDAAMQYKALDVPLIVIAGKEYGSGSSRDWAAKGTALLGIKAVLAESFERIHRSNLVGMGILPLQFLEGENAEALELTGEEIFDIPLTTNPLQPRMQITITAHKPNGSSYSFTVIIRLDTNQEITYYLHGGILPFVLRECAKS